MKSYTVGEYICSVRGASVLMQRRLLHIPLKKRERLRMSILYGCVHTLYMGENMLLIPTKC